MECRRCYASWPSVGASAPNEMTYTRKNSNESQKCKTHQKNIAIWCETCTSFLCLKCLANHKGHILDDVGSSAENMKTFSKSIASRMIRISKTHQSKIDVMNPQEKIEMKEKQIAENQLEISKLKLQIVKYENKILQHEGEKNTLLQIQNKLKDEEKQLGVLKDRASALHEICNIGQSENITDLTLKAMKMKDEFEMEMKALDQRLIEHWENSEGELKNDFKVRMVCPNFPVGVLNFLM